MPGVEELDAGDPEFLVIENARRKARAVERPEGAIVIACDTDVVLDGEVLGKPAETAIDKLRAKFGPAAIVKGITLRDGR